jgi:hypothetical protein
MLSNRSRAASGKKQELLQSDFVARPPHAGFASGRLGTHQRGGPLLRLRRGRTDTDRTRGTRVRGSELLLGHSVSQPLAVPRHPNVVRRTLFGTLGTRAP